MRSLKFSCPACGSHKFIFTCYSSTKKTRHGASCACCHLPLTKTSCFASLAANSWLEEKA
ncbi:hypothetical protein C2E15_08690 [Mixta gaviniae]|uniref:Uncharacterized protein n=1 Tax=Mixta gaviniae TaxID=665914 RepID=A0A2L0IEV5_9GAMM|nr:hypothetical protein C2E15_08690 [Mixta gaviniae]